MWQVDRNELTVRKMSIRRRLSHSRDYIQRKVYDYQDTWLHSDYLEALADNEQFTQRQKLEILEWWAGNRRYWTLFDNYNLEQIPPLMIYNDPDEWRDMPSEAENLHWLIVNLHAQEELSDHVESDDEDQRFQLYIQQHLQNGRARSNDQARGRARGRA